EGRGFRTCCAEAMALPTSPPSAKRWFRKGSRYFDSLDHHHQSVHGAKEVPEGLLSRLWPLQELIVSNTIQFVLAANEQPRYSNDRESMKFEFASLVVDLISTAFAWSGHDNQGKS